MRYVTMTPGGMYGDSFDARDDDAAVENARRRGYDPAEVIDSLDSDSDYEKIVVVLD